LILVGFVLLSVVFCSVACNFFTSSAHFPCFCYIEECLLLKNLSVSMGEVYNFNMFPIYSVTTLQYYLSVFVCTCCRIFIPALLPWCVILFQIMTSQNLTPFSFN
jgi:hypothetical protein